MMCGFFVRNEMQLCFDMFIKFRLHGGPYSVKMENSLDKRTVKKSRNSITNLLLIKAKLNNSISNRSAGSKIVLLVCIVYKNYRKISKINF